MLHTGETETDTVSKLKYQKQSVRRTPSSMHALCFATPFYTKNRYARGLLHQNTIKPEAVDTTSLFNENLFYQTTFTPNSMTPDIAYGRRLLHQNPSDTRQHDARRPLHHKAFTPKPFKATGSFYQRSLTPGMLFTKRFFTPENVYSRSFYIKQFFQPGHICSRNLCRCFETIFTIFRLVLLHSKIDPFLFDVWTQEGVKIGTKC